MKNLFIDANIWLSLYLYDNKILKDFESLKSLLNNKINLLITEQVYDEVLRNRDGKINDAWGSFSQMKFQNNAPFFCQEYPECKAFQEQNEELKNKYRELINAINRDIQNESLIADQILSELFNGVETLKSTPEIIRQAELRYKSGNPPGKKDSLGDAISWELLLQFVPNEEDLYLISDDGDYSSKLDKNTFNYFLKKEWESKKKSNVYYFTTLSAFLDKYVDEPDNSEDNELRDRMLRISKAMKDSMERIKKEHQYGFLKKSFEYNLENIDRQFFETILKFWTLKKGALLQTEDQGEEDYSRNSTDDQGLDKFEEDEDSTRSSTGDQESAPVEEDIIQNTTENQGICKHIDSEDSSRPSPDNQNLDQHGEDGNEDVHV